MTILDRILIALRLKDAPLPPVDLPKVIPLVPPKPHFVKLDKVRGAPKVVRAPNGFTPPRPMPPAPRMIAGETEVSAPGAALRVTQLHLTPEGRAALTTGKGGRDA